MPIDNEYMKRPTGWKETGTWTLVDYFDVWGNEEDGYEVNNVAKVVHNIVIHDNTSEVELIRYLILIRFLEKGVTTDDITVEWPGFDMIELSETKTGMPIGRLEKNFEPIYN